MLKKLEILNESYFVMWWCLIDKVLWVNRGNTNTSNLKMKQAITFGGCTCTQNLTERGVCCSYGSISSVKLQFISVKSVLNDLDLK